ncbi:GGDEF domain-containing protein [Actinokineospora bangkokensis]|uniref:GGDEF domain-containing protein n=1 Tax=Actinokineospora bangkokensis TaxID=1193682 RepID=UPI000AB7EA03|nr:GGDEF domain-containing protein [Actinokineospora bangkokensis]
MPLPLRDRWRAASAAAGWRFPSDWSLPEVDAVCAAADGDLLPALGALGGARARSGAGLPEVLDDVAALHAAMALPDDLVAADADALPAAWLRAAAEGWAEVAGTPRTDPVDPLTGLSTAAYLHRRLAEVYRRSRHRGGCPSATHVLLLAAADLSGVVGWPRLAAQVLLAETLHVVFDRGETLAVLGPSVCAALVERDAGLSARVAAVRAGALDRFSREDALSGVPVSVRVERLPLVLPGVAGLLKAVSRA